MSKLGLLVSVLTTGILISCSSPRKTAEDHSGYNNLELPEDTNPEKRLALILRRQSGVQVNQMGEQYWAVIYGNSLQSSTRPLFVINGHPIGHDFAQTALVIGHRPVDKIQVINDSEATLYGLRGSGGVIEIKVKKEDS